MLTKLLFIPALIIATAAAQPSCSSSVTDTAVPELSALDQAMQSVMQHYRVEGGSLAVPPLVAAGEQPITLGYEGSTSSVATYLAIGSK